VADRPADLPEFDRPPVVEVAIGIQFDPIRGFRQAHLGLFWDRVRADYPKSQDQERLETPIESLAGDVGLPMIKLELLDSPPVNRAWFISEDDSLLIQLQDDRLIHNWRHRGGEYPRFEPLLDLFWSQAETLTTVVAEAALSAMPVRQTEVTYINWIDTSEVTEFFRPSIASTIEIPGIGPAPDLQRWAARYPVEDDGELRGRLSVEVQPGRRVEEGKVSAGFQLALTFRAPVGSGVDRDAISSLLQLGRTAIVRTFTALTTDAMHTTWGRTT
jgi:uncharacterized protein (TIGR04255 family)